MIVLSTLLISTKSASVSTRAKAGRETSSVIASAVRQKARRFTRKRILLRRDRGRGLGLRQTLQHQARRAFGNVEPKLDVGPLHFHFRRLREQRLLGLGELEETLRIVPNSRG